MRNTCKTKKKTERRGEEGEENRERKEATNNAKSAQKQSAGNANAKREESVECGEEYKGGWRPGRTSGVT